MSKLKTFLGLIKTPGKMVFPLGSMGLLNWMPDSLYIKLLFRGEMGYRLDLKHPKTFNEKLQWLKIYDHKPDYRDLVDKITAKSIVRTIIGDEYIVPIYGTWYKADEIPFDKLPDQFVLKCNHDQGSVIIVPDKRKMNKQQVVKTLNTKLGRSIYSGTREYPYKLIKPKVFAEMFLGETIVDYKFYCFNGEPRFLYCGQGLTVDHSLKIDFFDLNWKRMPFYRTDYHRLGDIQRPKHLDEMIAIAKKLSRNVPFVRIDLFEVNEQVYFSEFTLCPASGLMPFVPKEYDRIIGDMLEIDMMGKKENM